MSQLHKLITSTNQKIVMDGIANKKTLKQNPEAKCMVCTWLKKSRLIQLRISSKANICEKWEERLDTNDLGDGVGWLKKNKSVWIISAAGFSHLACL